jgi:pyrimidine operon attenuation protein/uracil phosphoribosyltransferase
MNGNMHDPSRFCVADADRVRTVVDRMTRRIHAAMPEEFIIIGIRRRGLPLAERIAAGLDPSCERRVEVREITVKRYDDDLSVLHHEPALDESMTGQREEFLNKSLLLVDDVLFSGKTLLRVLSWLSPIEPASVKIAVLCARDTQEVPLGADFVGMRLDVGPRGLIDVHAPPHEQEWSVWLSHVK